MKKLLLHAHIATQTNEIQYFRIAAPKVYLLAVKHKTTMSIRSRHLAKNDLGFDSRTERNRK